MKHNTKKWQASLLCITLCGILTACGSGKESQAEDMKNSETIQINETDMGAQQENGTEEETGGMEENRLIGEQTFEVTLEPLGKVTFASYQPDTQQNPLGDALFEIQEAGGKTTALEGIFENNIRANEIFNEVEAVSFPDYNGDGFSDIIIICNYSLSSGPDVGTGYSEARIYRGNEDGLFTLERELSEVTNSALAEKTVQSVLGFLGAGKQGEAQASDWKQAYIDHLQKQDPEEWQGYQLIYLNDDEIPELVEIGTSEAAGCVIVTYADGMLEETRLGRLNFTYIERSGLLCNSDGNMDRYYDLVYRMENGRLTQIAAGYYGAEDNSRVEFDADGNPVYQYQWNDVQMSQEEYEQKLNAVYDTSKARQGYEWDGCLSREEAAEAVEGME